MPFRIDNIITRFFYITRLHNLFRGEGIPILMYHSISNISEKVIHPYYKINTSKIVFQSHMQYLHEHGYHTINFDDFKAELSQIKGKCKYVVVTFDDGYFDFYTEAVPILKKYNFTATVFLPTSFIDQNRPFHNGKKCMTWNLILELKDQGIRFGSHTENHPKLSEINSDMVEKELGNSKKKIEDKIGSEVQSFSYPYAFPQWNYNHIRLLKELLIKTGYKNGVTTTIGVNCKGEDEFFRKRIPMNNDDDLNLFEAKINGAYDWVRLIQGVNKYIF